MVLLWCPWMHLQRVDFRQTCSQSEKLSLSRLSWLRPSAVAVKKNFTWKLWSFFHRTTGRDFDRENTRCFASGSRDYREVLTTMLASITLYRCEMGLKFGLLKPAGTLDGIIGGSLCRRFFNKSENVAWSGALISGFVRVAWDDTDDVRSEQRNKKNWKEVLST